MAVVDKTIDKEKRRKEIKRLNKKFQKASRAEKRVIIAEDIITQLKAEKYKANSGNYILISNQVNAADIFPIHINALHKELQEVIEDSEDCRVCALGACFLSVIRITDNLNTDELVDPFSKDIEDVSQYLRNYLKGIFTEKQLILIETAFEGEISYVTERAIKLGIKPSYKIALLKAYSWRGAQSNTTERLIAIMENIIHNKGTFKP